jgi:hypothetical protein
MTWKSPCLCEVVGGEEGGCINLADKGRESSPLEALKTAQKCANIILGVKGNYEIFLENYPPDQFIKLSLPRKNLLDKLGAVQCSFLNNE